MDPQAELLAVFAEAVVSVSVTLTGYPVTRRESRVKEDHRCLHDYSGIIEFSGNAMGTAAICMPRTLLRNIAEKITGLPSGEVGEEVLKDAVGEIANQISGTAKRSLDKSPYGFSISTPIFKMGQTENFTGKTHLPCIALSFEMEGELFHLLISIVSAEGVALSRVAPAPGAEEPLVIDPELKEIVDGFIIESEEMLAALDADLVSLESTPEDAELINRVFRAFHTFKGNAGALGFEKLQTLTHRTEDIIRKVKDGKTRIRPETMDVILRSVDLTKRLVADIKRGVVSRQDLSPMLSELTFVFEENFESLGKPGAAAVAAASAPAPAEGERKAAATLRVDVEKLNSLLNASGELVLNKNRFMDFAQRFEQGMPEAEASVGLNEINAQLSILVSELQASVMSARMQPIGRVFSKYPRVVRDLSRDLGKEIELIVSGQETELDNTIVEEIADPLIHLVRNACDHGIETPQDRKASGKEPKGRVELKAYQEGGFAVIEIRDDGKGMDPEVLRAKAVDKGFIPAEQAARMSKAELLNLIFLPGFSTAKTVTAVSGRGVGMDVVKTNITKLNGTIELDSEPGRGSAVKIKLPLTMAVLSGLEIEVSGERYLLPMEQVLEIIPAGAASLAGQTIVDLRRVLGSRGSASSTAGRYVVMMDDGERRRGFLVDNVLQQQEVVIKPLGRFASRFSPPEVSGASIMGDGGVELILNSRRLLSLAAA